MKLGFFAAQHESKVGGQTNLHVVMLLAFASSKGQKAFAVAVAHTENGMFAEPRCLAFRLFNALDYTHLSHALCGRSKEYLSVHLNGRASLLKAESNIM